MTIRQYNLWTLTELRQDDPREHLELIIFNAKFDKVQAIKYKDDIVYVVSENQYKKIQNIWIYKRLFLNKESESFLINQ